MKYMMPMRGSCITMLEASTPGATPRSWAAAPKASSSFLMPRSSPAQLKISDPSRRRVTLPMAGLSLGSAGPAACAGRDRHGRDRVRGLLREPQRPQARHLLLERLTLLRDPSPDVVVALLANFGDRLRRSPG